MTNDTPAGSVGLDARLQEPPYAFQTHLGYELVQWSDGYARLTQPIEPYLLNRGGIPHGGVYATLLDTVMGYCGCFTGDPNNRRLALTLTLNTSFLSRPKGGLLIAEGRKTGGGRRTFFAESSLCDDSGEIIARASGAFRYRSPG